MPGRHTRQYDRETHQWDLNTYLETEYTKDKFGNLESSCKACKMPVSRSKRSLIVHKTGKKCSGMDEAEASFFKTEANKRIRKSSVSVPVKKTTKEGTIHRTFKNHLM